MTGLPQKLRLPALLACSAALATTGVLRAAEENAAEAAKKPTPSAPAPSAAAKPVAETEKKVPVEATKEDDAKKAGDEDIYVMSPFEVVSEKDEGYAAASAQSGSRLASKVEDISATMSVVTKQQLLDFALNDINDIFAMEASAEGTRTYTANSTNTNPLLEVDEVAQNPTTANRVRGLGTANVAVGNVSRSSTIPIDTYNIDAVEISRGPNSSIFGTGEVAGAVNLVPGSANLSRETTRTRVSYTDWGTSRGEIDINRPLIKNALAIRVQGMAENRAYTRKPAYDDTRRYTVGATAKPFANTTIKVSFEGFDEKYSRPNSAMPRSWMKLWEELGRPSWDPTTNTWTQTRAAGDTRPSTGVIAPGTTAQNPYFNTTLQQNIVDLVGFGSSRVRPSMFIDKGEVSWLGASQWFVGPGYGAGNTREIVQMALPFQYNFPAAYRNATALGYSSITATTDKSLYDYDTINLAALNRGEKQAEMIRLEVEQYFLRTQRHLLGVQLGYYREDIEDNRKTYVGNGRDGVPLEIKPDVNIKLPDGTPNPHYGAPYIYALAPQIYKYPIKAKNYKANLVYQLDLSGEKNRWVRLLGRQRLLGYAEYYDRKSAPSANRYTEQIIAFSGEKWVPTGNAPTTANAFNDIALWLAPGTIFNSNSAKWNARYYMGDGAGGNIDYGPSAPNLSNGGVYNRWGSDGARVTGGANNSWKKDNVDFGETWFAIGNTHQQNRTKGYVYQGFFWGDRIIPTYGERNDKLRTRGNATPANIGTLPNQYRDGNGLYIDNSWLWNFDGVPWNITSTKTGAREASGNTRTKGIVVKPFDWLHLRYNTSNSFKPEVYAVDFFGDPLPNPTGKTEDYGVRFNLFRNKLSIGLTKYDTVSLGSRSNSTVSTVATRLLTMEFDISTTGQNVDLQDWLAGEIATKKGIDLATATPEVQASIAQEAFAYSGFPLEQYNKLFGNPISIDTDTQSKGYELEINYNPTRNFTLRATAAQTEAKTARIGASYQAFRDLRLPVWQSIRGPNSNALWWESLVPGGGTQTFGNYFATTVDAPMKLNFALEGKPNPQTRKYRAAVLLNYRLAGISENRYLKAMNVGLSPRWESRGAMGFYGKADADGIVRSYDADKAIWDSSRFYLDLNWGYDFKLFRDKIRSRVQLNVRNALEGGRLQAYAFNPDGTPVNYRIVDPREFVFSMSFDL